MPRRPRGPVHVLRPSNVRRVPPTRSAWLCRREPVPLLGESGHHSTSATREGVDDFGRHQSQPMANAVAEPGGTGALPPFHGADVDRVPARVGLACASPAGQDPDPPGVAAGELGGGEPPEVVAASADSTLWCAKRCHPGTRRLRELVGRAGATFTVPTLRTSTRISPSSSERRAKAGYRTGFVLLIPAPRRLRRDGGLGGEAAAKAASSRTVRAAALLRSTSPRSAGGSGAPTDSRAASAAPRSRAAARGGPRSRGRRREPPRRGRRRGDRRGHARRDNPRGGGPMPQLR